MRFSGGKDSTLAALKIAADHDAIHLLTFWHEMIDNVANSGGNIEKLEKATGKYGCFTHRVLNISKLVQALYHGGGFFGDFRRYGALARASLCTACDFAMFVRTLKYCRDNHIENACDGANHTEFAGFLDDWGLPVIRGFAAENGVNWTFPVFAVERCDISLLDAGLNGAEPTLFFRSQARCHGGGLFANIFLRCYFLPLYGKKSYRDLTLAWLRDRMPLASEYIATGKINGNPC